MAVEDLSYIEKCFVSTLVKERSNMLDRTNGIVGPDEVKEIQTLGWYLKKNNFDLAAKHRVDKDTLESDQMYRTYVIPVTIPGVGPDGQDMHINLIVDPKGHDIGFVNTNADFKEIDGEFHLAKELKEKQNEILKILSSPENARVLGENAGSAIEIKGIRDVAERIAKSEKIVPDSPKEAIEKINEKNHKDVEYDEKSKTVGEGGKEAEEAEKESESMPQAMKSKIDDACEKAGLPNGRLTGQVKRAYVVQNPKSLTDALEGESLSPTGGEVIVLQISGPGGNMKNILVQGSKVDSTGKHDNELNRRFGDDVKNGITVRDAKPEADQELILTYDIGDGQTQQLNFDQVPIGDALSDLERLELSKQFEVMIKQYQERMQNVATPEEKIAVCDEAISAFGGMEKEFGNEQLMNQVQDDFQAKKEDLEEERDEVQEEQESDGHAFGEAQEDYLNGNRSL